MIFTLHFSFLSSIRVAWRAKVCAHCSDFKKRTRSIARLRSAIRASALRPMTVITQHRSKLCRATCRTKLRPITLILPFVLMLPTIVVTDAEARSRAEVSLRSLRVPDPTYRRFLGMYGNELIELIGGFHPGERWIGFYGGIGALWERGHRFGAETNRMSEESVSLLLIRPTFFIRMQPVGWWVQPYVEAGFVPFYFRITEGGTLPESAHGFRLALMARFGAAVSVRGLFFGDRSFPAAEEYDVWDFLFSVNVGYENSRWIGRGGLDLTHTSIGVTLGFVY